VEEAKDERLGGTDKGRGVGVEEAKDDRLGGTDGGRGVEWRRPKTNV
jgi:hypothetical protein